MVVPARGRGGSSTRARVVLTLSGQRVTGQIVTLALEGERLYRGRPTAAGDTAGVTINGGNSMNVSERLAALEGEAMNLRATLTSINPDDPVPAAVTGRFEDLTEDVAALRAAVTHPSVD